MAKRVGDLMNRFFLSITVTPVAKVTVVVVVEAVVVDVVAVEMKYNIGQMELYVI